MLDKVAELPVSTWSYKAQGPDIRHIGPMAQDFTAAFGVGEDDRHITSVDADGVALAAIKGLDQRVDALSAKTGPTPIDRVKSKPAASPSPAAVAGIAAFCALLAAALGAAAALRWSTRAGGRLATG